MRKTVQKMLKKYLFAIWVFSSVIVLMSFHLSHEDLTNNDYKVIISIVSGIGIVLYHTANELWEFIENIEIKKRGKPGASGGS